VVLLVILASLLLPRLQGRAPATPAVSAARK
jgi:hypothetical protein